MASGIRSTSRPARFPTRCASLRAIARVTEGACRKCHADIVQAIDTRPHAGRAARLHRAAIAMSAICTESGRSNEYTHESPHVLILYTAVVAARRRGRRTALLVNIFQRQQEARNPFYPRRRAERRDGRSGGVGKELPAAVRRLQAHGRSGANAVRRQRSDAAHADQRRSAVGRRAVAARGGSAAEDDVGGIRVREGFSRGARPRVHAGRPDVHRASGRSCSSPARACTATRRSTCRTRSSAAAISIKGFER